MLSYLLNCAPVGVLVFVRLFNCNTLSETLLAFVSLCYKSEFLQTASGWSWGSRCNRYTSTRVFSFESRSDQDARDSELVPCARLRSLSRCVSGRGESRVTWSASPGLRLFKETHASLSVYREVAQRRLAELYRNFEKRSWIRISFVQRHNHCVNRPGTKLYKKCCHTGKDTETYVFAKKVHIIVAVRIIFLFEKYFQFPTLLFQETNAFESYLYVSKESNIFKKNVLLIRQNIMKTPRL